MIIGSRRAILWRSASGRDLSVQTVERLGAEASERAQMIAKQTDTNISLTRVARMPPALADANVLLQTLLGIDA